MNEKQYLESLLESDQLQIINGTAYFNNEPLHDPTPAESDTPNEFGFLVISMSITAGRTYGLTKPLRTRPAQTTHTCEKPQRWSETWESCSLIQREQLDNAPDEIRAIYRMNSQNRLNRGAFLPLLDADGVPIEGRYWPMIGNYAVPGATTRRGLERNLKMKIDFMLRNQRDLIAGGGGTLADRSGR